MTKRHCWWLCILWTIQSKVAETCFLLQNKSCWHQHHWQCHWAYFDTCQLSINFNIWSTKHQASHHNQSHLALLFAQVTSENNDACLNAKRITSSKGGAKLPCLMSFNMPNKYVLFVYLLWWCCDCDCFFVEFKFECGTRLNVTPEQRSMKYSNKISRRAKIHNRSVMSNVVGSLDRWMMGFYVGIG